MIEQINELMIRGMASMQSRTLRTEDGVLSIEYIAVALVLIAAIMIGFAALGGHITSVAKNLLCTVTNNASGCKG